MTAPVFEEPAVFRLPPKVDRHNEHYWRGGADGELRFLRCDDCGLFLHPPRPVCRRCLARDLTVTAVSGRGSVHTYTVNHQEWNPTMVHPYALVLVELDEQEGLRVLANLVDCPVEDARIGLAVEVCFEHVGDGVYLPQFRPA